MGTALRRIVAAAPVAAGVLALTMAGTPASASSSLPLNWSVKASTHLKTLNETVHVPKGSFKGSVNLSTGHLTGRLKLPAASAPVGYEGANIGTATFKMVPTKPISGKVNLSTLKVTTKSVFNIDITSLEVSGVPVNLVGSDCATATPITLNLSGKASLTKSSTFSGTYTIPDFANCELLTPIINSVIAGPGNSFSATFSPST